MGYWDTFKSGDRFKFVQPGDSIEGEVINLSTTTFGGTADPTPVLLIRTSEADREVTASQAVLVSRLAEQCPEVGDWVRITYDGDAANARPGKNPAKLFTVTVKRATPGSTATTGTGDLPIPESWSDEPF